jgi:hypothetical protein
VIAPGVNLSLEALHMAAAALPHVDVAKPARRSARIRWPACSPACIGAMSAWSKGIVREDPPRTRPADEGDRDRGLASLFAQGTELFDSIEDDLTMHGLVLINDFNKEKPHEQGTPDLSAARRCRRDRHELPMSMAMARPGKERLILVDLGVTFPDMDGAPGVDLIMPDIDLAGRANQSTGSRRSSSPMRTKTMSARWAICGRG